MYLTNIFLLDTTIHLVFKINLFNDSLYNHKVPKFMNINVLNIYQFVREQMILMVCSISFSSKF